MDEGGQQPGLCKNVEECPVVLNKWLKEMIYPKTCYFIKKEHFVCCPKSNTPGGEGGATDSITVKTTENTGGITEPNLLEFKQRRSETG